MRSWLYERCYFQCSFYSLFWAMWFLVSGWFWELYEALFIKCLANNSCLIKSSVGTLRVNYSKLHLFFLAHVLINGEMDLGVRELVIDMWAFLTNQVGRRMWFRSAPLSQTDLYICRQLLAIPPPYEFAWKYTGEQSIMWVLVSGHILEEQRRKGWSHTWPAASFTPTNLPSHSCCCGRNACSDTESYVALP